MASSKLRLLPSGRRDVVVAAVLLFLSLLSAALLPLAHSKTVELTNFEFENRVAPGNTVVVSATPSGNLSQSEFGTLRVVTNVLRDGPEASNSTVLGSVVGLVNTLRDDGLYLTFNFVYETAEWNGTIGVQGRLDSGGNGELVVTGGSGDFRLAQGWCETTLASGENPASIVFKNVVHLKLDD